MPASAHNTKAEIEDFSTLQRVLWKIRKKLIPVQNVPHLQFCAISPTNLNINMLMGGVEVEFLRRILYNSDLCWWYIFSDYSSGFYGCAQHFRV